MILRGENRSRALGTPNDIRLIPGFVKIDQLIHKLKRETHTGSMIIPLNTFLCVFTQVARIQREQAHLCHSHCNSC